MNNHTDYNSDNNIANDKDNNMKVVYPHPENQQDEEDNTYNNIQLEMKLNAA